MARRTGGLTGDPPFLTERTMMLRRFLSLLSLSLFCALAACGGMPEDGSSAAEWRKLAADAADDRAWIADREKEAKAMHVKVRQLIGVVPEEQPKFKALVDFYVRLSKQEDALAEAVGFYDPILERIWTGRGFPGIESAQKAQAEAFARAREPGTRIEALRDEFKALSAN